MPSGGSGIWKAGFAFYGSRISPLASRIRPRRWKKPSAAAACSWQPARTSRIRPPTLYFLNSPRGRAAAESFAKGQWQPESVLPAAAPPERPNLFKLYEENIGPLTPLIADALKDSEQTYPPEWVAEALETAVRNNKRNWKYVEAILRRWKEEGHAKKQDRRDAQEDGRRYAEGEYSDFIEH